LAHPKNVVKPVVEFETPWYMEYPRSTCVPPKIRVANQSEVTKILNMVIE
jgi:hypothetical protein